MVAAIRALVIPQSVVRAEHGILIDRVAKVPADTVLVVWFRVRTQFAGKIRLIRNLRMALINASRGTPNFLAMLNMESPADRVRNVPADMVGGSVGTHTICPGK